MKKYLILIACAVLFASCYTQNAERYDPLSEADKQAVPYRLGDEVRFVDGTGTPVTLQVASFGEGWRIRDESGGYEYLIHQGCRVMKLRSQDGAYGWTMELIKDFSFGTCINVYKGEIDLKMGEVGFWGPMPFVRIGVGEWHDSVTIGGRMYYEVVNARYYDHQCYYNKTEGILQLRENDSIVILERLP